MKQLKVFYPGSKTTCNTTLGAALLSGRPFYFDDPDFGLCAPTEKDHDAVAGSSNKASGAGRDYTKDNPLTPGRGTYRDTTPPPTAFQNLYEEPSGRDYTKNNPLTPKKDSDSQKAIDHA